MLQCFPTVISYTQCSIHYVQPRREECALHLGAKPALSSFRAVCRSTSRRLLRVDVHVLRVSQKADPLLLLPLLCHLRGTERARFVKRRKKKKVIPTSLLCSLNRFSLSQHLIETDKMQQQTLHAAQLKHILLKSCQPCHPLCCVF